MLKPNLNLPLASSYNERGVAGSTHTITNSEDQRKINCFYEVTKNALSGQGKLTLSKRPGAQIDASTYGVSAQVAYLIHTDLNSLFTQSPIVFSTQGTNITVSGSSVTNTICSASSGQALFPMFVDKTLTGSLSETLVIQVGQNNNPFSSTQQIFFNTTSIGAAWTTITDVDLISPIGKMEFMDGFSFILNINNQILNSDLNSISSWPATGFITKQIKQDFPIGLARLNNQILGFGAETVEAFYNAGNATGSPLLPIKQLTQRIGMIATNQTYPTAPYYAIASNKLFFVGRRAGGASSVGVFSYNGSIYEKVSPSFIDKILNETNISFVGTFGFNGQLAIAISLTTISSSTPRWLMFFPDWNDWFEWTSTIFKPINNGAFFLGTNSAASNSNKVYKFASADNWQDNGTSFTMQIQFKLPQDGHQRKRMAEFGVLADTARASNQLLVEFSDDDYVSWQQIGNIELQRDIKTLNRGGSYRQRAVRLSSTNALETRLSAFIPRIE